MDCEKVLGRLWEYLDRELDPEESVLMKEHLVRCSSCFPVYCCNRSFLDLLARQRRTGSAPASLVLWARSLIH
jgi:mycothiol system anti-sigma-R factor